ncbi:PREDICTED: plasminogen receptor (KT) [Bactrocera latifrons]|uniref:Plasminogen receptor (KT) n=2 Tax=Bactrocera TaxID=47832 RepID=A0A6I9UXI5_BACDO|nr:plasminogen receptor (KT) [Bactrocera dorsalis]XP_018798547.1 PREDICTED: plasminogen receptor (KT) [Bactrocera latifrons]XP_039962215.1 plasminogen receptor (KT) [Bactrocera tryoni]XP_050329295.1 plasminogen receptor (KT) [Bactrocera neohumeralis]
MGSSSSRNAASNFPSHDDPAYRKCQELKMERWIQLHYQIKEREMATYIAGKRELFYWLSAFYMTSSIGCWQYYQHIRRKAALLPMVPLTFVMAYYADLAYGSKVHRIQAEANMILEHENELLHWPGGLPTVSSLDEARVENEIEKKLHPHPS